MPMRVIAKKRCRAMFEPPEKGERTTLNPNLSTRLNLLFLIRPLGGGLAIAGRPSWVRFGHASLHRREVAPTASGHCDLRADFPRVISGLRRPIAIQAAISLNMNLPE
jgi:hypothetical protein